MDRADRGAQLPVLHETHFDLAMLAAALAGVAAGHAVGSRAFARLDTHRFDLLLLAVIPAAGAATVAVGVSRL